jgi:rSAM/selenodomain-associated transferase 2
MARNTTFANHISVIVPVYNESGVINDTLDHLRRTSGQASVEIVVADGGPGHATLAAVTDGQAVRVKCPQGRGVQMNAGAAMATGDVFLFLHADTRLPEGWPGLVRGALVNNVRAGAFSLGFDSDRLSMRVVALFANLRTRIERLPYGDQAPFLAADLFREMGGFAGIPIMEDVDLFSRLRQRGERIVLLRERVATSPRRYETDGVGLRVVANWWLRLRYGLGVSPHKLAGEYRPRAQTGEGEGR